MNIVILDDYQDAVRKLECAAKLEPYQAKVYTNTVKGLGQLSVRLKDADVIVLNRERTHLPRQLIEKLPKLKLVVQTGRVGPHIDVLACTERGIAVAEGVGSPVDCHSTSATSSTAYGSNLASRLAPCQPILELAASCGARRWGFGATEKLGGWLPGTPKPLE